MDSFKSFLSEHVVLGKPSSGVDLVGISSYDPSKLIVVPSVPDIGNYSSVKFSIDKSKIGKYIDQLRQGLDQLDPNRKYTYSDYSSVFNDILKTFDFSVSYILPTGGDNLDKLREVILHTVLRDSIQKGANKPQYESPLTYFQETVRKLLRMSPYSFSKTEWITSFENKVSKEPIQLSISVFSGEMVGLDHHFRTVILHDDDLQVQNRMRAWKSDGEISSSTYVYPLGHTSTKNNYILKKMLESLIKQFPNVANYHISDREILSNDKITVREFISPTHRVGNNAALMANKYIKPITVYHGTSLKLYQDVIRHEGIVPGKGNVYGDKVLGHSEHLVYCTFSASEARKYAVRAGGSKGSVILQVVVTDFTKIVFDEDTFMRGYQAIAPNIRKEIERRIIAMSPDYADSVDASGFIERHAIHTFFRNIAMKPERRPIVELISGMVVAQARITSFGYKGSIPASKIKLVEQFKAGALGKEPSSDLYKDKYVSTMQTFKSYFK